MLRVNGTDVPKRRSIWCLPCLLGGLAAASVAGADQARTTDAILAGKHGAAPTTYRVINLGAGDLTQLPAINASGQLAFSLNNGLGSRAWFYNGTAAADIGTLGGPVADAVALNNAGQVAGFSPNASGLDRAFVWSSGSGMVDLGVLPGASSAMAAAINNLGVVTGNSSGVPLTPPHAFRWSAADGMEDLGAFTTGSISTSYGEAINDAGLIAGFSTTAADNAHAFAWTRTAGMIDLGTLGGDVSYAAAVGAKGQVAGYSTVPGNLYHAFLWTRGSGMHDLGTAGGTESFVLSMSANGHIAGVIDLASGDQHAMSWTRTGGMLDLGTLGGTFSRALSVNTRGQVVGLAGTGGGAIHAYVWTAKQGMVDLNKRLRHAPAGLTLDGAVAISDNGSIVATSNAGLVLLKPGFGHKGPHAVGPIAAAELVQVGTPFDAGVSFAAEDTAARHNVSWSWGDGSGEQAGNVRAANGAGNASGAHNYTTPGIYTVTANVVDLAGKSVAVSRKIVAYDPSAGVVGGIGAIMSPQGANRKEGNQAGKATFSFVAPTLASAKARSAKAQLHFNVGTMSFRSENLRPVTVLGAHGQFQGNGTINGAGDYKFTLATTAGAAGEGEPGRFSLRIWHIDPATKAEVVDYDNRSARPAVAGGPLVEGTIAVQR
jgi:probable HAF family extracellular repeat protein